MVRLIEHEDIVVYTDDVLGHTGEWRSTTLILNPASFGMAINCSYTVFVSYRRHNFNIQPPKLPAYQTATWDLIGNLEHAGGNCVALTPEEQDLAQRIQYGISYEEYAKHNQGFAGFTNPNKLQRFSYVLPLFELPRWYLVHPRQHRCISDLEFNALADDTRLQLWLHDQVSRFEANCWKELDFATRFDAKLNQWVGDNVNGARHKTFNLLQYVPPLKPADMFPEGLIVPEFQDYKGRKRR